MATTVPARLEVRLDPEHRKKLAQLAAEHHQPISEIIRQMIDKAYEDEVGLRERRGGLEGVVG
jgi:predicted transcriptional regulator